MSDFVSQYNENYIPTTSFQKILLSVGSAAVSLLDPKRAGNTKIQIIRLFLDLLFQSNYFFKF